jgi:hypothetical protein
VARAEIDDGVGASLMHRQLHRRKSGEHAVELEVIAGLEVRDGVLPEAGAELEGVGAGAAGRCEQMAGGAFLRANCSKPQCECHRDGKGNYCENGEKQRYLVPLQLVHLIFLAEIYRRRCRVS